MPCWDWRRASPWEPTSLYYVALIAFGLRIFNNIAIIRRLLMGS